MVPRLHGHGHYRYQRGNRKITFAVKGNAKIFVFACARFPIYTGGGLQQTGFLAVACRFRNSKRVSAAASAACLGRTMSVQAVPIIRRETQVPSARVPTVESARDLDRLTSRTLDCLLFIDSSCIIILAFAFFLANNSCFRSIIACACRNIYWHGSRSQLFCLFDAAAERHAKLKVLRMM